MSALDDGDTTLMDAVNALPDQGVASDSPLFVPGGSTDASSWAQQITDSVGDIGLFQEDNPFGGSPVTSSSEPGFSMTDTQNGEQGMIGKLLDKGEGILSQKGDTVGAMMLAMALKGLGGLAAGKRADAQLQVQKDTLSLAQDRQKNAQTSMTGVSVPGMKQKAFDPSTYQGMISRKVTA